MDYFDSHTHVQFAAYDDDRHKLIKNTFDKGVGMINVGTNLETSHSAIELAHEYKDKPIFATVGLHPTHTYSDYKDENEINDSSGLEKDFDYEAYKNLANKDKVVAIGECGLDYFRLKSKEKKEIKKIQTKTFEKHLELAKETNLPLMIHCRPSPGSDDAYEDLIDTINSIKGDKPTLIIHFFVGSKKITKRFLDLGAYFTFGGVTTFVRDYDEIINYIPIERIMFETDAPYVTPEPHRGKRNEPLFVKEVYKQISELKNVNMKELQDIILKNNESLFNIELR